MKHMLYQADLSALSPRDALVEALTADLPAALAHAVEQAIDWSLRAQQDTLVRPRGIEVALILRNLRIDGHSLAAALLSDPYLRETTSNAQITQHFGDDIANLVGKVNWLNTFTDYSDGALHNPQQSELLRRMILAVVKDMRVVIIKLAYRLQRLRLLTHVDTDVRERVARETLELFAPLANRLGIAQLKWELEDLSFRYLHPALYRQIAHALAERRSERERYLQNFSSTMVSLLQEHQINGKVYGRPKHIYSIWQKLARKEAELDALYDLRAVRVIVPDRQDCYKVLSLVHERWTRVAKEFDDYIVRPKENGYQSLHTVVEGPDGKPVEVQIRTQEMHLFAEYGVAAHWRYKEGAKVDPDFDARIAELRRQLESRLQDPHLLDNFKAELETARVFVLTPRGMIISLANGATPLDFAYAIHTEVGHRCRGAKVNGRIVPLDYILHSGEQVEILTTRNGVPSRNWLDPHLGYLKTAHARSKVRQFFKQLGYEEKQRHGRAIVEREARKLGIKEVDFKELVRHLGVQSVDDLLIQVANRLIGVGGLSHALAKTAKPLLPTKLTLPQPAPPPAAAQHDGTVTLLGVGRLAPHFAQCCKPAYRQPIGGYLTTQGRVTIHRVDCGNLSRLAQRDAKRLIEVAWDQPDNETPPCNP